jgi:hypothetical protein
MRSLRKNPIFTVNKGLVAYQTMFFYSNFTTSRGWLLRLISIWTLSHYIVEVYYRRIHEYGTGKATTIIQSITN